MTLSFFPPNTLLTPYLPTTWILPSNRYKNLFELIFILYSTIHLLTSIKHKNKCLKICLKYEYKPIMMKYSELQ